jgi:acyl transferase domain-containing protein
MSKGSQISLAVIGIACRFAGGANDPDKLWNLLEGGRSAWSGVPADRFDDASFRRSDSTAGFNHHGGHFLDQDVRAFDADFFGIPPGEAHAIDPQARIQLETAYEALENAGIPLENVRGSSTSVFVAIFSRDYDRMQYKDPETLNRYTMLGTGDAILSNRISYVFDLRGASMTIDTGCSGSLVALHQACQSLRMGESDMALVGGTNLILSPEAMISMGFVG